MRVSLLAILILLSCKEHTIKRSSGDVPLDRLEIYGPAIANQADEFGAIRLSGSIGDSALFSCLGLASGWLEFNPGIFFENGKPLRHPLIYENPGSTPVSKDVMAGLLWCLYSISETVASRAIIEKWITYGKAHTWVFCDPHDIEYFHISPADFAGRCVASPQLIRDIYLMAKHVGAECDSQCEYWIRFAPRLPVAPEGYEGHLAVLGILRNGLIEGKIDDLDLEVLRILSAANPNNALYLAAYHTFLDGDQKAAREALENEQYFPADRVPDGSNYCTDYLFQRSEWHSEIRNPDWEPCQEGKGQDITGRGLDWLFARRVLDGL